MAILVNVLTHVFAGRSSAGGDLVPGKILEMIDDEKSYVGARFSNSSRGVFWNVETRAACKNRFVAVSGKRFAPASAELSTVATAIKI